MKGKSKLVRYINIILGIPNKRERVSIVSTQQDDTIYTAEPAGRQMHTSRNGEKSETWQLKADFDRAFPVIQPCEQSF
ncbi:MAG: hypothetical protein EOP51_18450 [Sphingobacteriales bacterium]|nr:MAG: hypothetical protein EOP51_18450 [Sphingobacteriales bacterium]